MDCAIEEDFYAELLERVTGLCLALVAECADVPADAIMMGDDWGDQRGVLIGPERWRRFYKPRYARIFDAIHDQGKLAIMHCCGSVADIMGDIVETGLDVLESVQPEAAGMDPYALKREWGDKITFWGCLGSQQTIPSATPGEIRREIRRLRSEMGKGGGHILAPAKPLRPETPTENAVGGSCGQKADVPGHLSSRGDHLLFACAVDSDNMPAAGAQPAFRGSLAAVTGESTTDGPLESGRGPSCGRRIATGRNRRMRY